jgi:hypothetical protein
MKGSSLAERLDEFAAIADALESGGAKPLSVVPEIPRPAPKRLALGARRIQIRDQGLRPFRVS